MKALDLSGQLFGRLSVIAVDSRKSGAVYWRCKCACGESVAICGGSLKSGNTRSCGCLRKEVSAALLAETRIHGEGRNYAGEYKSWSGMKARCCSPSDKDFQRYGGRGIAVCDRWRDSYVEFLSDMGRKPSSAHTLERNDNDGNYEPGNCRWATRKEQANNRRPKTTKRKDRT